MSVAKLKIKVAQLDWNKLLNDEKFLKTAKDLAQNEKFEPVPPKLKDYWVTRMWCNGVINALYSAGFEIIKKEKK